MILIKGVILFDIASSPQKQFAKIINSKKIFMIFIEFWYLLCSYSIFRRVFLLAFQGKVVFSILFHNFSKIIQILWILARFLILLEIAQFCLLFLFSFVHFELFCLLFHKLNLWWIESPFLASAVLHNSP